MYADGDGVNATTIARSNISRNSPTAMPTTIRRPRGRALSPTPSWRSATTISTAFPNVGDAEPRAGAPDVRAMPRPISAIPRRSTSWPRSISTATASTRDAEAGGALAACSPPTRATTRRRRCSAACCSTASRHAPGALGPDVAHRRQRRAGPEEGWITDITEPRSLRPPKMSGRWPIISGRLGERPARIRRLKAAAASPGVRPRRDYSSNDAPPPADSAHLPIFRVRECIR